MTTLRSLIIALLAEELAVRGGMTMADAILIVDWWMPGRRG